MKEISFRRPALPKSGRVIVGIDEGRIEVTPAAERPRPGDGGALTGRSRRAASPEEDELPVLRRERAVRAHPWGGVRQAEAIDAMAMLAGNRAANGLAINQSGEKEGIGAARPRRGADA